MFTLIRNSLANLKGHKLRLVVAFIWIIIGITSVIFVSGIGNSMKTAFSSSFESIEPRTGVFFFKPESGESDEALTKTLMVPFEKSDVQAILALDNVEKAVASKKEPQRTWGMDVDNVYGDMAYFNKSSYSLLDIATKNHYKLLKGRALNKSDEGRNVIVINDNVAVELFGDANQDDMNYMDDSDTYITAEGETVMHPEEEENKTNLTKKLELEINPIGKGIKIGNTNYEVVGICDADLVYDPIEKQFKHPSAFSFNEPTSYIPESSYNILSGKNLQQNEIRTLRVTAKEGQDIKLVSEDVISTLYSLHPDILGTYEMQDQSSIQKSTESMTKGLDTFVTVLTIIAMILGGIGIMNIMYVSVMERNKEIGIRRALGARPRSILFQFLVESMFITFIGGILGLPIGYAITIYSGKFLEFKPDPSLNSLLYSVIVIVLTGIIAGLVPAYKAAKVDPVKTIYK